MMDRIAAFYDQVAERYDLEYAHPVAQEEDRLVRTFLCHILGYDRSAQVLDLGCGTGLFLDWFPDHCTACYVGIDLSQNMIARATAKHPTFRFVVGDMQHPIVPPGWADLVIALYGPPSYLHDPMALQSTVLDSLRSGGRFLLMPLGPAWRPGAGVHADEYEADLVHQWSVDDAKQFLHHSSIREGRIIGMTGPIGLTFPRVLPYEARLLRSVAPERARYLLVSGVKL